MSDDTWINGQPQIALHLQRKAREALDEPPLPRRDTMTDEVKAAETRGFMQGLDRIANFINSLDSSAMSAKDVRTAIYSECLTARPLPQGEVSEERAQFAPYKTASRKFINSAGNEINIEISTGASEQTFCKTDMWGPSSGFENYTTWDELVQLQSALSEVLGLAALSQPKPEGDVEAVEVVARALTAHDPDRLVLAGNPLGEPAEYPAWMLNMPLARKVLAALSVMQKGGGE